MSFSLFAQEEKAEIKTLNKGFIYLKLGASSGPFESDVLLSEGFGYRTKLFKEISGAIDINIAQIYHKEHPRYFSSEIYLPKVSYQYYLTPLNRQSFFLGIGYSFAMLYPSYYVYTLKEEEMPKPEFYDAPSVSGCYLLYLGYDLALHSKFLNTLQLELNIPQQSLVEGTEDLNPLTYTTLNLSYCIGY